MCLCCLCFIVYCLCFIGFTPPGNNVCDKLNNYQTQTQKVKHCSCILKLLLIKSYQTQTQKDKHCSCILKLLLIKSYQTQTQKDKHCS